MKRLLWLLPLLLSCTTIHTPPAPSVKDAQRRIAVHDVAWLEDTIPIVAFRPPFVYGYWRLQVEACVGKSRPGWPRLFIAPVTPLGSDFAAARTYPARDAIVFGLGSETEGWIVRHEFIHWLALPENTADHPAKYFGPDSACWPFVNPSPKQG